MNKSLVKILYRIAFIHVLFFAKSTLYGQQNICYGSAHTYKVDETENGGNGSTGSIYSWQILEDDFEGEIFHLNQYSSGNQIKIDWQTTPEGTYTLVVSEHFNSCIVTKNLSIQLIDIESLEEFEDLYICEGSSFNYSAPLGFDNYLWTNEQGEIISEDADIEITQSGVYILTVGINGNTCTTSRNLVVYSSDEPIISEIETVDNNLVVHMANPGDYEYSLNQIFWQNSNVFTNLEPGLYHVYVRDRNGCGLTSKIGAIIGVTNFISPNNDGYNDTWEIRGLEAHPNTRIQIFDRYGKIIVDRIINGSFVWDGKYKGDPVNTGSYWYILILPNGERYTGHINVRNY